MVVAVDVKDIEFGLTIAAIPVTILILIMAGYFTRKESLPGMIATIVSSPQFEGRGRHSLTFAWLRFYTLEEWPTSSSSSFECTKIKRGSRATYTLARLSLLSQSSQSF